MKEHKFKKEREKKNYVVIEIPDKKILDAISFKSKKEVITKHGSKRCRKSIKETLS